MQRPFLPTAPTPLERRHRSVRTLLVWLVLACLLPGVLGAGIFFVREYREGRSQLEKDTLQTARALSSAVDNQVLRVEAFAQGLASHDSLARGNLAGFDRQAREALKQAKVAASVVLIDHNGQQILNTRKPFGTPLPLTGCPDVARRVFETGEPAISDLYRGAISQKMLMTVAVPVTVGGKVAYALSAPIPPDNFNAILHAQGLPPGWVATILDGKNAIVARSRDADVYLGHKPAAGFLEGQGDSREGAVDFIMKDGVPVLSVYTRSPVSGWTVAINIPQETLAAHLSQRLSLITIGLAALFAIGLGFAWVVGGQIAGSFRALRAPALALGAGEPVAPPPVAVQEAAEAAKALGEAAVLLRERTAALLARETELAVRTAALRQTENRLQTLTQHAPAAIAVFDRDMRYLAVSRRWRDNFRLGETELLGRCHYDVFPGLPERWKEAHRRGLSGEVLCAEADRFERADGSVQWVRWELWPWRDASGEVGGIVIASEDITESKEAERRMRLSEEKYRTLFANMSEGFALGEPIIDDEGKVKDIRLLETNEAFHQLTGLPRGMVGRPVRESLPLLEQSWVDTLAGVALSGEATRFERYGTNTRRHYDVFAFRPSPGRFAIIGRNVTEQKLAIEAIEKLNAELEDRVAERTAELVAANRELESFTFAASHDLRGPLGRINSFSTMLERQYRDRLEGDGLVFLDFIRQNATRLTRLVEDLLSHARVAQQAVELQPVDMAALVREVIQDKGEDIREVGAVIKLEVPGAKVLGDFHTLGQALSNLIENALKYSASSQPPVIEIGGQETDGRFRLWVRDNGIGFDMAYHDRIFEMFRRLHTYNQYEGSGVGLALVKRAMERVGGRVWAESRPGRGATFYLELQVAETPY